MTRATRVRWAQLRIGIVVTAVVTTMAGLVFFIDELRGLTEPRYTLYFETFTLQALRPRARVWLAGRPVGRVAGFEFQPATRPLEERLRVKLRIRSEVQPYIQEGSVAQVITSGLVGESVVNIRPAPTPGPPIPPGGELPTAADLDPAELLERLRIVYRSVPPILERWRRASEIALSGSGTAQRLAARPEQLDRLREQLDELTAILDTMSRAADNVGRVLDDRRVERALARLGPRLTELGRAWREADGSAALLLTDAALLDRLDTIAARLARLAARLNHGTGSLGRLLNDRALVEEWLETRQMLRKLREEMRALAGDRDRQPD